MNKYIFIVLVLWVGGDSAPSQQRTPIPPGMREADNLPGPADVPPINRPGRNMPSYRLMIDQVRELAELAQGIPGYVAQVTNGTLPKDMGERLKRIEAEQGAAGGDRALVLSGLVARREANFGRLRLQSSCVQCPHAVTYAGKCECGEAGADAASIRDV